MCNQSPLPNCDIVPRARKFVPDGKPWNREGTVKTPNYSLSCFQAEKKNHPGDDLYTTTYRLPGGKMDQNEEGLQYISDKNIPDLLEVSKVESVSLSFGTHHFSEFASGEGTHSKPKQAHGCYAA